mmetsp:Transcript_21187/g.44730  ORF Transcript_21187/g.44730 Transcript_21187/m.44730 type:complete len:322 (-) Transcript_21187:24-989(-)
MSASTFPPFLENSHDDGSKAAVRVFFAFLCMWEALYHIARIVLKLGLSKFPHRILDSSLFSTGDDERKTNGNKNGHHNKSATTNRSSRLEDAKRTLLQRGPSYVVSFFHSVYVTGRGFMHLYHLWNASKIEKVLISGKEVLDSYRWAHLDVTRSNTLFLAYLIYDLVHILFQYPKLGGIDTIAHHALFASCSIINGTYGVLPFAFGWLIVGEASTIFLNTRWFLLKSGRESSDLLSKINNLFAATFFLTRIGIYSLGIIDLFYFSFPELQSLPAMSGVPIPFLGMTCGCVLLGWALNFLWGFKIFSMMSMVGGKKKKTKDP